MGKEKENLAYKFYEAFMGKANAEELLEIDKNYDIVSKEESEARIKVLQLVFGLFCLILSSSLIGICDFISVGENQKFILKSRSHSLLFT